LREAQENESTSKKEEQLQRAFGQQENFNFGFYFDEYKGNIHLEALEMGNFIRKI
jgi:hypothetical protein